MSPTRPAAPEGLARVGFGTLALALALFALPLTRESFLLIPAILLAGAGFALIGGARGPALARYGAGGFAAYVGLLLTLFLLATPFTYGSPEGPVFEKDGFPWAVSGFDGALQALPLALIVGAGVAAWPWSPLAGRVAIVTGLVLLSGFIALDWLSEPQSFDNVSGAERIATTANWLMSLATLALLTGVGLLVAPLRRGNTDAPKA